VTFLPGETNQAFVIPLLPDSQDEAEETIEVHLSGPAGGAQLGVRSNALVRLNAEGPGAVDATFVPKRGYGFVLPLAEGKVLVLGPFDDSYVSNRVAAIRLLADGSEDPSFRAPGDQSGGLRTATLQSDGKIIVGGNFAYMGGRAMPGVARLQADGSLDTNFVVQTTSGEEVGGDVAPSRCNPTARC